MFALSNLGRMNEKRNLNKCEVCLRCMKSAKQIYNKQSATNDSMGVEYDIFRM